MNFIEASPAQPQCYFLPQKYWFPLSSASESQSVASWSRWKTTRQTTLPYQFPEKKSNIPNWFSERVQAESAAFNYHNLNKPRCKIREKDFKSDSIQPLEDAAGKCEFPLGRLCSVLLLRKLLEVTKLRETKAAEAPHFDPHLLRSRSSRGRIVIESQVRLSCIGSNWIDCIQFLRRKFSEVTRP